MVAKVINPNSPYIQQGDCILKKCGTNGVFIKEYNTIPEGGEKQNSPLVLRGQNNTHALYDGEFEITVKDGVTFIRVTEECILDHVKDLVTMARAEHMAHVVPVGEYFMDQVNEYNHLKEESAKLID